MKRSGYFRLKLAAFPHGLGLVALFFLISGAVQAAPINPMQDQALHRLAPDGVPPTLGNYPAATAPLGTATLVMPDAAPANTASINVFTSTTFKGTLEGNPVTGIVRVTNAHPAGIYTVTVKAFGSGGSSAISTFPMTVTTPATCPAVNFAAVTNFSVGAPPQSVAIGDLNGDGKQDLAVATGNAGNVSILLGDGGGGFGPAANFSVGTTPRSVALGDFNGDGKQDLAVANSGSFNVSILLGDGAGSFGPATNFSVGDHPAKVAVGDFNGDGKLDLAVANALANVSILLGDGNGGFSPAPDVIAGATPLSVAVGDFNGDGQQDLAVANYAGSNVSILLGNGSGGFGPATNFSAGSSPMSAAVGDFNGDGKQDLAVANAGSGYVSILLGDGAGSFSPASNFFVGTSPSSVAVGDFNGDGKQDLVAGNETSFNVSILLGDGSGGFSLATNFLAGSIPLSVAVGDFNSDGKQDLVVANVGANQVSVLLRDCLGPTPTPSPTTTPALTPAQALNISTRLRVETADRVMIGGFIITGNEPKRVAIRGLGPSLANFGLSDVLADPTLELRGSDGALLAQNDDWQDNPEQAGQLTALGLALQDSNESGMVATLDPGAYTAIIAGKNQTSGFALVEIYDADTAADSRLVNISTRGFVQAGDNVMIGGFILGNGGGSTTVAVRGLGPSLGQSGLNNVLADPILELRDANGAVLIANDNWQDDSAAAAQLTAQGLAPSDSLESGIFATVTPGLFTAILAGQDGGSGLGLLEIYGNLHPHTLIVTSTSNSGPGTLDQALTDAEDGDVIQFDPSLYGQTIGLNGHGLRIDKSVVISGPGPNLLSVQLSGLSLSVFEISSGHTVILEGLTIRGGHARIAGGGIRTDGSTLTVNQCVIGHNMSDGSGGGIYNGSGGKLTVVNSVVSQNSTTGMLNSYGGGIYNALGSAEIRHSTISDNRAANTLVASGVGGGIANSGTMTITNSTVRGNVGAAGAGIGSFGPLTITNSTISGNMGILGTGAASGGGGTYSSLELSINNCTISGNSAHTGGGLSNYGSLTITNSTISDNGTGQNAGSIDNRGQLHLTNTILKAGSSGTTIFSPQPFVTSGGYNLSSDSSSGFLTAPGDQINTDPMLGQLQNNGGPTFTHELLLGSPAINAGTPDSTPPPAYDQRGPGYPRVINGQIDIGSFEVQPAAIPTPTP